MDNIFDRADNVGATMRAFPWLTASTTPAARPMTVTVADVQGRVMPVDGYSAPDLGASDVCTTSTTIDRAFGLLRGLVADHKFSTRLGLSASPPV
ncbi:MAG TPA: hypothetical protein VF642_05390 [Propionibacteriaceae bacterium]